MKIQKYNDDRNYESEMIGKRPDYVQRADAVRDIIFDLVLDNKLDRTDLRIISARNCSPMPSFRSMAADINIPLATIYFRVKRIKRLVSRVFQAEK
jgi:hypothetical protein